MLKTTAGVGYTSLKQIKTFWMSASHRQDTVGHQRTFSHPSQGQKLQCSGTGTQGVLGTKCTPIMATFFHQTLDRGRGHLLAPRAHGTVRLG